MAIAQIDARPIATSLHSMVGYNAF